MVPIIQKQRVIQKNQPPHRYDLVAWAWRRLIVKRVIRVPGDSYARSGNRLLLGASGSIMIFLYLYADARNEELPIGASCQVSISSSGMRSCTRSIVVIWDGDERGASWGRLEFILRVQWGQRVGLKIEAYLETESWKGGCPEDGLWQYTAALFVAIGVLAQRGYLEIFVRRLERQQTWRVGKRKLAF